MDIALTWENFFDRMFLTTTWGVYFSQVSGCSKNPRFGAMACLLPSISFCRATRVKTSITSRSASSGSIAVNPNAQWKLFRRLAEQAVATPPITRAKMRRLTQERDKEWAALAEEKASEAWWGGRQPRQSVRPCQTWPMRRLVLHCNRFGKRHRGVPFKRAVANCMAVKTHY